MKTNHYALTESVLKVLENSGKTPSDILESKDSVCIPIHNIDVILEDDMITIEELKDYLDAIRNLSRGNYEYKPNTRFVKIMFADLLKFIKYNNDAYINKTAHNAENGRKGGRPRKTRSVSSGLENNPKKGDNDNEYDYDYDNDNDYETIEDKSPIVVVEEFDNNKSSFKSVLKVALMVFCKSAGDNKTRWSCALNEYKGNELWKFSLNCIFFCDCDIASVMRVGTIIDELILSVGKEETITSVANIVRTLCVDGKYKDKGIEEKSKILIGSINKFKEDCK